MRALLAFVALAVAGIAVTAVILANNNQSTTDANVASRGPAPAQTTAGQRYDGGREEGTASIARSSAPDVPAGIPSPAAARNLEQSGQIELRRDPHSAAAQLHQLQGR
jgi:uncharacterized iron-regulated membrane protein